MTIRRFAFSIAAAAMYSPLVHAQDAPPPDGAKVMAPIRVEADEEDPTRSEGSDAYTPKASTTAFKLPLSLRETPQTVTVIPQEVIKDFNLENTRDILQFTPGVHVQNERNTQAYFFKSRGFEMQTQWDGVPSPNGFGGRGQNTPDAALIDRVEVLHGANGLLSGPGSPGGTVNLWHKTPGPELATAFEISADSFGGYRLVGDVGGPFTDGGIGGRAVAVHEEQQLYIDDASGKHNVFYGILELPAGDSSKIQIGGSYEKTYDANFAQHFGIPSMPDGSLRDIPRDVNLGAAWAHENTELLGTFLRAQHSFANGWTLHGMFQYETTTHDALEGVPNAEVTPDLLLWAQIEGWDNQSTALDLFAEGPVDWFGRSHQLMFGFNGAKRRETQDDYQFGLEPVGVLDDPVNWNPADALDPQSVTWDSMHWGNGDRKQYGPFAAGRFELQDAVHAIVGARMSWAEIQFTDSDPVKEDGKITPYAGITWDFSKHWSTYLSYSEIFQMQDSYTRDFQGDILQPVVGENLEVGLKVELLDGAFNGSLAVYRLDQTNLAEEDFANENPGVCGGFLEPCYKATGLVRSEGFDLSLSGELGAGWKIIGGYSFIEQEHRTGDSAGLRYDPLTPKNSVSVAAAYNSADDRWGVRASLRWQSEVYSEGEMWWALDEDGEVDDVVPFRIQQDSYTVFGVFGSYKINERLELDLAAENLFDEEYLSGISWPAHGQVWGEPRRFTLMLTGTF